MLTLNPDTLKAHTNIAPFIGPMTNRVFRRYISHDTISLWERFRNNDPCDEVQRFKEIMNGIDVLSFAGATDTTVLGRACLSERQSDFLAILHENPNIPFSMLPEPDARFKGHVLPGDHADVFANAVPIIRYLASKPIDTPLPIELQKLILPITEMQGLPSKTAREVMSQFVLTSLPNIPVFDLQKRVDALLGSFGSFTRRTNTPNRDLVPPIALTNSPLVN
ncbi:MAG: hypothetical protein KBF89_00425 [Acidimicrobiia bacterium]|nr:hypothetical protein [Acidimicrobiia bacterium]